MSPQAFDPYASTYDAHFTHSWIGKAQRARVLKYLDPCLAQKRGALLELNCGTGEDAVYIAEKGIEVTATDISPEMIRVAKQKDSKQQVKFIVSSIQELTSKTDINNLGYVFSDFGGLNCLNPEEFRSLAANARRWLNADGYFIAVIMGRKCWWERFFFSWRGEKTKAARRTSQTGVDTVINEQKFLTWYYSPKEVESIFQDHFHTVTIKPIGLFIPPSYLEDWIKKYPVFGNVLILFEKCMGGIGAFANYADHYIIVMQKKEA
ncbi:MAG: methyltransferase domain-containing protein [Bacteroidetes bacterium]|nr:methyltransferase domain-containing protein [Bacteroidota bacterium]